MGLLVLTDDKETASTIAFEHTGLRPGQVAWREFQRNA